MEYQNKNVNISLCMIVKNEEKTLSRCLNSLKKCVDQMIIVDTGSNDRTIEIAESFGAEVYHFKWVDDFAKARNESIKYAKGQWILWMDADEALDAQSVNLLLRELKGATHPSIFRVQIKNQLEGGSRFQMSDAHRIFSNHVGIYFEGRIHEQIYHSSRKAGAKEIESNILIHHYGYDDTFLNQDVKNERNHSLLEKMVADNPADAYGHFTLGQNYILSKDYEKALHHLMIADKNNRFGNDIRATISNALGEACFHLNKMDSTQKYAQKSIKYVKKQSAAYYLLFKVAEKKDNSTEALKYLDMLIENTTYFTSAKKTIASDILLNINVLIEQKAKLFIHLKQEEKAVVLQQQLWDKTQDPKYLHQLIALYQHLNNVNGMKSALEAYYQYGLADDSDLDLLGNVYIQLKLFQEALEIYLLLNKRYPQKESLSRRIAGIYAKLGEREKMLEFLKS